MCSKKRAEEIDLLLTTQLKVPSCWSKPRVLLTSTTGIKIADCLALCGDYGAYVIGLTDIEDTFKQLFIRLLNNIIKPILQCSPSDAVELTSLQTNLVLHMHVLRFVIDLSRFANIHTQFLSWFQYNLFAFIVRFVTYLATTFICIFYVLSFNFYVLSIYIHNICHDFSTICLIYFTFCYSSSYALLIDQVDVLAQLECKLPSYWNTLTRHFLYCRVVKQIRIHGGFKAHNMLSFESAHVFLKSCSRSTKNLMASIRNHYQVHVAVQSWRFDAEGQWVSPGRKSGLLNSVEAADAKNQLCDSSAIPLHGKQNYRPKEITLDSSTFSQVQDLWAIESKTYDRLRDRYKRQTRNTTVLMADWDVRGRFLSDEELKMKGMTPDAQVCSLARCLCTKRRQLSTKRHLFPTKCQLNTNVIFYLQNVNMDLQNVHFCLQTVNYIYNVNIGNYQSYTVW